MSQFPQQTNRIPFLRLRREQENLIVEPFSKASNGVKAILLPRIPSSLVDWMSDTCQAFWNDHRRCLGFLLLFDLRQKQWSFELPAQSCGPNGAAWKITAANIADANDSRVIAGSFQIRPRSDETHILELSPKFPGLHFFKYMRVGESYQVILRCEPDGVGEIVDPQELVQDDHEALLEAFADRLTFT